MNLERIQQLHQIANDCLDSDGLNDWEKDFLDKIEQRLKQRYTLTEKQEACLLRIHKQLLERFD